jgi:predicted nucleic acid-binding protein
VDDLILDACCLINLAASENVDAIVEALKCKVHVCTLVAGEALYLRTPDAGQPELLIARPIKVSELLRTSGINVCETTGEEETNLYVRLASSLDDGEAKSLAIASHRGWGSASDDRKAVKIAASLNVPTLTTPEMVKRWARHGRAAASAVSKVIRNIETFARFVPRRGSPQASWWKKSSKVE